MSLWTPDGEHPVDDDHGDDDEELGQLTDEERRQLEEMASEMASVRQQLLSVPASQVVANHVMGLYELAAIHLSSPSPRLEEARLSVDAMAALVDALEGRLGEHEPTLRDALAQLQLAFVQVKAANEGG